MRFAAPLYALLFIPVLLLYIAKFKHKWQEPAYRFPTLSFLKTAKSGLTKTALYILETLALFFLILALMRPQFGHKEIEQKVHGYAIMMVMDTSLSMMAADLRPSRFEVAKDVIREFVQGRVNDLVGFTIFSGTSVTLVPVTLNTEVVVDAIENTQNGMLEDGTAIGMGIASAVGSLKDSEAKTKVIVLLTDGDSNMGAITPESSAEMAKEYGIKIYAIGVGARDEVPFPMKTPFGTTVYKKVRMDFKEDVLKDIASITGGLYYRATDNAKLKEIYEDINKREKSEFKLNYRIDYRESFYFPLFFAFFAACLRLFAEKLVRKL